MRGLSTKFRLALGLSGLLASLVLLSTFVGVVPDKTAVVRNGRAALAESVAANASDFVSRADLRRLEGILNLIVERNDDLHSAALRRANDQMMVEVGDHQLFWEPMSGQYSTDSQVKVPIWADDAEWGQVELRFESLSHGGLIGFLQNPWVKLVAFLGVTSFIAFYFYLGRALKHLDPSQAIPARVRAALDTMAEGLMVLDRGENIVLANQAFAVMLDKQPDDLIGTKAAQFPWKDQRGQDIDPEQRPWRVALAQGAPEMGRMVKLQMPSGVWRSFLVNCSPVMGGGGQVWRGPDQP